MNRRTIAPILTAAATTMLAIGGAPAAPTAALPVSPEARDMIVFYETGGRAYYDAKLRRPTVPPGASGVTIGIGYDLGYNTPQQIAADWTAAVPPEIIKRLQAVAGKTGAAARAALPAVRSIEIPWTAAVSVYERRTVPRFSAMTLATYPGIERLNPHIGGTMLSTTFNRGTALAGDRRRELLASRNDIAAGRTDRLAGYQLAMRRLWPTIPGLQKRYAAHAALIDRANEH